MLEVGLIAGYLAAWAWQKAKRVGAGIDQDVDEVLDASLGRLHEVVAAKLGADPALERLELEAAAGVEVTGRTRRRVEDAVAEAADRDLAFASLLEAALAEVARAASAGVVIAGGDRSVAVGGNVDVSADRGSAAAVTMGEVNIGGPPGPTGPGPASG
jgi:hypothetical protein